MKTLIASSALVLMSAGTAIAGPYAVIENNGGFSGSTWGGSATDFHIGWDGGFEGGSYYAELGPTLVNTPGEDAETILTAKAGGSIEITPKLSGNGEVSVAFDDTNSYGTKAGLKYSF